MTAILGVVPSAVNVILPSGDTTGATDTTAVNTALSTVNANVKLAIGTYYFNAAINPGGTSAGSGEVTLEGSGWGTILRFDGTVVSPAIVMGDTTLRNINIRNLRIAQTNAGSAAGTCILADYFSSQSIIEGVKIDGLTKHWNIGIDYGLVSTNTHYTVLKDSRIQVDGASAIGVRYGGGASGAISNVMRNCRILISGSDATQTGIVVATKNIELHHPDIESGAGIAIDVQSGAHGCTIVNPYLDVNGTNIQLASAVIGVTVIGGHIAGGTTADITDNGATAPKFIGVHFTGNVAFDELVLQQSAAAGKILRVTNTATGPSDAAFRLDAHGAAEQQIAGRVTGDTANRWRISSSGKFEWGTGSATPDAGIARGAAAGAIQITTDNASGTLKSLDGWMGGMGALQRNSTALLGFTIDRATATVVAQGVTTSGTVYLTACYLPVGVTIGHISMVTGTGTLKTGGTHGWYCLCDSGYVVRDATADQVDASTVWGVASTEYNLATTAGYVTTYAGLYYVGMMVANSSGTQPNMVANTAMAAGITGLSPAISGPSSGGAGNGTGMTTAPATDGSKTFGSITAPDAAKRFLAYVLV
jgi:hypothetical protein